MAFNCCRTFSQQAFNLLFEVLTSHISLFHLIKREFANQSAIDKSCDVGFGCCGRNKKLILQFFDGNNGLGIIGKELNYLCLSLVDASQL